MPTEAQNPLIPVIPETITVHLGSPSSNAPNVTVSFSDYIKNVASSELYPTWPEPALRANILAQISFALNRIYTEYYRSRGYNFDITSSTAIDQSFVNNRDIFENVSHIVDDLFGTYLRRINSVEPLFAQYCNGTTTTCEGMSQWGSVALAENGLTAFEILQHYYGDDIELVENAPIGSITESVPPLPLRLGFGGNSVALLQTRLNRISVNYPNIPKIANVDGFFGTDTRNAVIEFQKTFNLVPDGVVGRATWYEILRVYNAVKRLNELNSEQLTFSELPIVYPVDLREGNTGYGVELIQYYLSLISLYNNTIPAVAIDGIFGPRTANSVSAFQRVYGLPETGIVDADTFFKMYDVFLGIINSLPNVNYAYNARPFPGTSLLVGSTGEYVRLLQTYLNTLATVYPEIGTLAVDGIFGEATENAVKTVQRIFGLPETGVVNLATWNCRRIRKYFNRQNAFRRSMVGIMPNINIPREENQVMESKTSNEDVIREAQKIIVRLSSFTNSISPVQVDGIYGSETEAQIRNFQRYVGLPPTGILDQTTFESLVDANSAIDIITGVSVPISPYERNLAGRVVSKGEIHDLVTMLQIMLQTISVATDDILFVKVNGQFDDNTQAAVERIQELNGLPRTGDVDLITWNRLSRLYNKYVDSEGI